MRFAAILRTETRKFLSLKLWWLAGGIVPLAALAATAALLFVVGLSSRSPMNLDSPDHLLAAANLLGSVGYVVPLGVGVLIYTSDVAHRTLAVTLIGEPSRTRIYASKVIVAAGYGAALGVLTAVGGAVGTSAGLRVSGSASSGDVFIDSRVFLITVTFSLWAVLGVGLGSLIRSSLIAIVGALAVTQLLEPLARLALSTLGYQWAVQVLPGAANDAAIGGSLVNLAMGGAPASVSAGMAVLACYAVLAVAAGAVRSARFEVA
ncbi:hypothetical protein [Microbacterium sp. ZW T5_56]|uniref:hypothetical protein n=1 Tax=Microbacterium sp. ZW T5_56 TaxID=3378081 RepID=UPI0038527332